MQDRERHLFAPVVAGAVAVGTATWWFTMASAPRYSFGEQQDMGNGGGLLWSLLAAALVGGFALPRFARVIALGLGLSPLVMAPWTAPRGDNDGLWVLIVPMLAVFVVVLIATAAAGSKIRGRFAQRAG